MMKNRTYILLLALLLGSCVKESLSNDGDDGQNVEMKLSISRKADGGNDEISNVRLVIVNRFGDVKFNESKPVDAGSPDHEYTAVSRTGKNDFYAICNETPEMTDRLNAIRNSSDIEAFKILYNHEIKASPLVMYGEMRNVEVTSTGDEDPNAYTVSYTDEGGTLHTGTKLPIAVKRLVVRVSLSFIKSTPDFTVSDIRVKVVKLPEYSFLKEGKAYDGELGTINIIKQGSGELLNDNTATFDPGSLTFKYDHEGDAIVFDDIYLPEYILSSAHQGDADKQTAIIVSGQCTTLEGQVVSGNWRINLMKASNKLPRNSWYKIAATISGMGAIGLYADIKEVSQYDIPVNWKPIEGLTIVGNRTSDYNSDGTNKNTNIWNDYTAYSGVLKVYHSAIGYSNVLFKYGSVIATRSSESATGPFDPAQDIAWRPSSFTQTVSSWADIPYSNSGDIVGNQSGISNGLGDPCKLVALSADQIAEGVVDNKIWHLATPEEYERLIRANDFVTGDKKGYNAFHSLIVPNTRSRHTDGALANSADKGAYWSSQAGKAFEFESDANMASVVSYGDPELSRGYTVRCVRNTIPESYMSIGSNSRSIDYKGGTCSFSVATNIPYWKGTLITPDNVLEGETPGTGTEYNDLEFVDRDYGQNDGTLTVRLPFYLTSRTFKIRIVGMGYDGVELKEVVTVTQHGFSWYLGNGSFSPALPDRLPGSGWNAKVTVSISPEDPRVPIPSDKPYYIWVYATRETGGGSNVIFDSKEETDGRLGIPIVAGQYKYEIDVKIPASDNIDATTVKMFVSSNLASYSSLCSVTQNNNK